MKRRVALACVLVGAAAADVAACNAISGVGDFTFGSGGSSSSATTTATSVNASSSTGSSSSGAGAGGSSSTAGGSSAGGGATGGGDAGFLVPCGPVSCEVVDKKACCFDNLLVRLQDQNDRCVDGTTATDGCTTENVADGGRETRIECERPDECPQGDVCCGTRIAVGTVAYYATVACQSACASPNIVLCTTAADCPPPADGGVPHCQPSQLLPNGYLVCK
ncbi:MAG TPA: hypothetical protein VHB21_24840 [Minicystis sp.]|nr:hypothetical protein [Minicystis sp.]